MKICTKCGKNKEDKCFRFEPKHNRLRSWCKQCDKEYQIERNRKLGIGERKPKRKSIDEIPAFKVCTRCKENKPKTEFDPRICKGSFILRAHCKDCDKAYRKAAYDKKKDDPLFKEKNRIRTKEYVEKNIDAVKKRRNCPEFRKKKAGWENKRYHRIKDRVSARMKIKRQTPEYKQMMREYRTRNKHKIYSQEVITKRRYHEKNRDNTTDKYVKNLLRTQGLAITPEIVEAKRLQILIKRKIKNNE